MQAVSTVSYIMGRFYAKPHTLHNITVIPQIDMVTMQTRINYTLLGNHGNKNTCVCTANSVHYLDHHKQNIQSSGSVAEEVVDVRGLTRV